MKWSPQQEQALKAVKEWLDDESAPQIFRLFGCAGTGKSTLAKEIAENVQGSVMFMAFTGKAALVMRKKGCYEATTIHSAIYRAIEDKTTGVVTFELNRDSQVSTADLIIVDEVSMVDAELGQDLMWYGVKILVLGDPFQLPPIKGEGFFTAHEPDVMLTEIHRQAQENPIIRLSMDIREGRGFAGYPYGDSKIFNRSLISDPRFNETLLGVGQILCGMNKTRLALNERTRVLQGLADPERPWMPVIGDKLVCVKNNSKKGLLNGGMWEVEHVTGERLLTMIVKSLDDTESHSQEIEVPQEFFQSLEATLDWRERKKYDEFTFGNTLTVHKSQGSQWDNVLIIDESRVFREHADRHLYTAITRAAEKVYIAV